MGFGQECRKQREGQRRGQGKDCKEGNFARNIGLLSARAEDRRTRSEGKRGVASASTAENFFCRFALT